MQAEMKKLGYNKEKNEQLISQQKQLTQDVRILKEKLETLEAK